MSDVVMKEEDSDTLSVEELGAFLPPPPPPPPPPPHKPSKHGFYPPPSPVFELPHHTSGPTTSVNHVGHWTPVDINFPSTPQDELKRNWEKLLDALRLPGSVDDVPRTDNLSMSSPVTFECLPPFRVEYRRTFGHPYTPSTTYSPPAPGGYNYSQSQDTIHAKPLLFAKIALHCYNLENGTHFERLGLPRSYDQTLEARDPVCSYTCEFETNVRLATENKDSFHVITTRCRPLPPLPPPAENGFQCGFDSLSVDEIFKGSMPDWLPDDYATSTLLMQYYEMKESEVEQAKEWLYLYAELALYTKQPDPFIFEHSKPLELRKVIAQTRGVVDSVEEVMKLDNAVFFVSFKTSCGDVCKGIIRRTKDGRPEHLSLEAKCFMSC